jgi:type I restriction enzyme S subunit
VIAELKPYAKYKDSSQAWLGEIPQHWPVLPNRAIFAEVKDRNHPDEEMLSVTITRGIVRQRVLLEGSSKKDSSKLDKTLYKLVQPGDIAYNKMRAWQGAIGVSAFRGIVSPAYVVMRVRGNTSLPEYFHHLYRTPQFAKEAERWSYGITSDMWSLRPEHFKLIYTPSPPRNEQQAIVRFLDWANGRLERTIRAKRRVIAVLTEQKQAIIHRAVTSGLDASVPLKPSGIPWLGNIPNHWDNAIKMKYISTLKGRLGWQGLKAHEYTQSGPAVVSSAHFTNQRIQWDECPHVSRERYEMDSNIQLSEGDILLMKDGAAMGKLAFVESLPGLACLNSHLLLFRPLSVNAEVSYDPKFMFYFMQTGLFQDYVHVNGTGATFLGVSQEALGQYKICLPPINEQRMIAEALDVETRSQDKAIALVNEQINLLRLYRTRLVADVATGKVDVREAAGRLPGESPIGSAEVDVARSAEAEIPDEETAP